MRRRIGGLAVALFAATLAAAVAGCSGAETASGAGADGGAAVRPAAPDFTVDAIKAAGGELTATTFTLSEQERAVSVLYFSFVGWPTCGLEAPVLGRIQQEYASRGVGVVAIDIYDGDDVFDFVKFWRSNGGGDVTWALAPELVPRYGVRVLGQTVVIDRAGGVVYNGPPVSYSALKKYVEAAL